MEIAATIKIADGSQAAAKVLTSDANGLASWQVPKAEAIGFLAFRTTNTTITNSTSYDIAFTNINSNDGGAYNAATWFFTVPKTGVYQFSAFLLISHAAAQATTGVYTIDIITSTITNISSNSFYTRQLRRLF